MRTQKIIFGLLTLFLLYVVNLFIFTIVLIALLTALSEDIFLPKVSDNKKYTYITLLGLLTSILWLITSIGPLIAVFGPEFLSYYPEIVEWGFINIVIQRFFINTIILPLLTYTFEIISKKNIKNTLIATLIILSTISVIWQARYRTVGLESDINFAHDVIIESMKEHVEHIYPRKGIFLDLFVYGVESQKTFTIKHFLQQYTIADITPFTLLESGMRKTIHLSQLEQAST